MSYHIFGIYKTEAKAKEKAKWFRDKAHFRTATVHKCKGGYEIHASGYKKQYFFDLHRKGK